MNKHFQEIDEVVEIEEDEKVEVNDKTDADKAFISKFLSDDGSSETSAEWEDLYNRAFGN